MIKTVFRKASSARKGCPRIEAIDLLTVSVHACKYSNHTMTVFNDVWLLLGPAESFNTKYGRFKSKLVRLPNVQMVEPELA